MLAVTKRQLAQGEAVSRTPADDRGTSGGQSVSKSIEALRLPATSLGRAMDKALELTHARDMAAARRRVEADLGFQKGNGEFSRPELHEEMSNEVLGKLTADLAFKLGIDPDLFVNELRKEAAALELTARLKEKTAGKIEGKEREKREAEELSDLLVTLERSNETVKAAMELLRESGKMIELGEPAYIHGMCRYEIYHTAERRQLVLNGDGFLILCHEYERGLNQSHAKEGVIKRSKERRGGLEERLSRPLRKTVDPVANKESNKSFWARMFSFRKPAEKPPVESSAKAPRPESLLLLVKAGNTAESLQENLDSEIRQLASHNEESTSIP